MTSRSSQALRPSESRLSASVPAGLLATDQPGSGNWLDGGARHRLVDLVPPPRTHRHRYHGVFAPNLKLRRAVTALAIGNIGKRGEAATGGHAGSTHATGCCDTQAKPRSHDTSRKSMGEIAGPGGRGVPA